MTGEIFLQMLESRLDSVIYRLGFAKSRSAARQFVGHGHICVNGKKTDIASYIVKEGDEVEVRERIISPISDPQHGRESSAHRTGVVNSNADALKATINRLPNTEETEATINVQLIVEYYSR